MASRPPPRFVVRRHDETGDRRRYVWLGLVWLASLVIVGLVVGLAGRHTNPAVVDLRQQRALQSQIDDMKQQLANGQRDAQVNDVATRSLRATLTQRESEISGLRANLGFYARLVGGETPAQGLKLQEVKLESIPGSRGWNLMLSLMQDAKRTDAISGSASITVEGLRADKVVQLDQAALGDAAQKSGMPFRLMYFQQLHTTIVLPTNFRPMRLRVSIQATGEPAVVRTVSWEDALAGGMISAQGDHDAQP